MSTAKNYVLRSVYISPTVDDELRLEAFEKKKSKNELIRSYIEAALAARPPKDKLKVKVRSEFAKAAKAS